jgi:signal peptidase I
MDIIAWWKRYRSRKQARELVEHSRKLLRMHRDIIDDKQAAYVESLCDDLRRRAIIEDRPHLIVELSEKLEKALAKAFPPMPGGSIRENVEVFLVAAIVAMAIRSFFIQPFKIPTGSMQPTLYGQIKIDRIDDAWPKDGRHVRLLRQLAANRHLPLWQRLEACALYGIWPADPNANIQKSLLNLFAWTTIGQWPSNAYDMMCGDHIFVDRFTYHFRKPQRGDVVVFETNDIYTELVTKFPMDMETKAELKDKVWNKFYIKRMVGVGGDRIQVRPPYLLVNSEKLDSRLAFERIYSCANGYHGYVTQRSLRPPCYLGTPADEYEVPQNHYFVLGDNSLSSFDGRFWGAFPRRALIGRAVFVYWPFTKRFGSVE